MEEIIPLLHSCNATDKGLHWCVNYQNWRTCVCYLLLCGIIISVISLGGLYPFFLFRYFLSLPWPPWPDLVMPSADSTFRHREGPAILIFSVIFGAMTDPPSTAATTHWLQRDENQMFWFSTDTASRSCDTVQTWWKKAASPWFVLFI